MSGSKPTYSNKPCPYLNPMKKVIEMYPEDGVIEKNNTLKVTGEKLTINGETYFKISNVDQMRPFFMSLVSDSNHWLFISSNGGLSAGRKNSNFALFPYYTDDKITESLETTGSKSIFWVAQGGKRYRWEPFSERQEGVYSLRRNLYKNALGNTLIFEEINDTLGLSFQYAWNSSHAYGFVRTAKLVNLGEQALDIKLLDGIQNIIPHGVEDGLQNSSSNLVDSYKKCELETDTQLGIYSLSAIIVDRAEPSEALKANVVWLTGLPNATRLISSRQLGAFRKGHAVQEEIDCKAEKGAYFCVTDLHLAPKATKTWRIVANVNQSITSIIALKDELLEGQMNDKINRDIALGSKRLVQLTGAADGLQVTGDERGNVRHFANTLFNIMRGGIFDENYQIEKADFIPYIQKANRGVGDTKSAILDALPEMFTMSDLKNSLHSEQDTDFIRLCIEYLPLKFSRRHGDPSRPWNKFSINTQNELDGSKVLDYQGNWRDIFQNWEALAHAYPEFIEGMIYKFLNTTTFDGYNPYRVTKDGFDWETIEPDNPWAYIGYWGDHQIIYLLKFLEFSENHFPEQLQQCFHSDRFVYANVPYRIKPYDEILKDPKNTIDYDWENERKIEEKRSEIGVDGALLFAQDNTLHKVNFLEKILATALAKMANFIPEGGIWMNTQRPEWNDANNALVGNGVSMVTLYYMRRFFAFLDQLLENSSGENTSLSEEMASYFNQIRQALANNRALLNGTIDDTQRKMVMDALGTAASDYRWTVYNAGFTGAKKTVAISTIIEFVKTSLAFIDHSIAANKRPDGLYHAYNLMTLSPTDEVQLSYLAEMLEGQVAVLSAGLLTTEESLAVLDALKASALFRPDQYSYILYPNKTLPRFVDKNTLPKSAVEQSILLQQLVADGNRQIVERDSRGDYHFNGNFNNVDSLKAALKELPDQYQKQIAIEQQGLENLYEEVFDHKSFTGRSGTFFGYEGLGSIYWHMVSKLLLATYEVTQKALDEGVSPALVGRLYDHYFEIQAGIGAHKSPELYGAFPTDPYSHTPAGKGAQQPGMTGQVKEDIISRFGELGVRVANGKLYFDVQLLRDNEFLSNPKTFHYIDVCGEEQALALAPGSLAFTYCQVPVVYQIGDQQAVHLQMTNGEHIQCEGLSLSETQSKELFGRTHAIKRITLTLVKK